MSEPVRPDFVQGLTPLRGIAAMIVVFYHYNIFVAEIVPADRFPIVDRLALMVDFFFILSGFIMCHNYGAWFKQGISAHAFRSYLGARFARLYPLHLATFAAILAIGSLAVAHDWTPNLQYFFDYHGVVPQLLMAQAWGYPHEATWNTPAWSISIEFLLYLIFPLLILGLARTGWIGRAVFVAILAVSAALVIYRFEPAFWRERYRLMHVPHFVPYPTKTFEVITGPGAMLRGLYSFGIGLLLHDLWESRWAERMLCSAVLPLAISIGLVVLWSFKLIADPVAVLLLAVIILSVACRASLVGRALEMQPFRWLGDVSYAILPGPYDSDSWLYGLARRDVPARSSAVRDGLELCASAWPSVVWTCPAVQRHVAVGGSREPDDRDASARLVATRVRPWRTSLSDRSDPNHCDSLNG